MLRLSRPRMAGLVAKERAVDGGNRYVGLACWPGLCRVLQVEEAGQVSRQAGRGSAGVGHNPGIIVCPNLSVNGSTTD